MEQPHTSLNQAPLPKTQLSQALTSVFKEIDLETSRRSDPTNVLINGREYPISNELERAMSDLQASVVIAQNVLDNAVKSGDHQQEKVAAKAFAGTKAGVEYGTFYAELIQQSPEAAAVFKKNMLKLFDTSTQDQKYSVA